MRHESLEQLSQEYLEHFRTQKHSLVKISKEYQQHIARLTRDHDRVGVLQITLPILVAHTVRYSLSWAWKTAARH